MFIGAQIDKATLSCTADGDKTWSVLQLDCSPTDASGVLEIGDRHVFATKFNRPVVGQRQSCDLRVFVKRRSSLIEENVEKHKLSASKIGYLGFFPAAEKDQPASLEAEVFISDGLFDSLVNAFQAGRRANWLRLEIEKQGVLEYGAEPDGSCRTWKVETSTAPSFVDAERIDVDIELFD